MKKSITQLETEAIDLIAANISQNMAELQRITETGELTIDRLEALMGNLKSLNNQAVSRLYDGYVNSIPEKDLIAKKKLN
ncbi:hypothetical protein AGMMS49942_12650 [Spirochaetia bacterium]|nr:hypothetical protein AGMMS49942_12650 [Spirochaetia bacterium]